MPETTPSYPVNTKKNNEIYMQYKKLADQESHLKFGGRLATYQYLDMDDTIEQAIRIFQEVSSNELKSSQILKGEG
jgi:UDP-galactopyranose mutase